MTQNEIRNELKEFQYYFRHKQIFDKVVQTEDLVARKSRIKVYEKVLNNAPRRIKDVFYGLYEEGNTQKVLSQKWNVCEKYIQILNKRLIVYLETRISEKPKLKQKKIERKNESSILNIVWFD